MPLLAGKGDKERRSLTFGTVERDVALVHSHDFARKSQPQSVAAGIVAGCIGCPVKQGEYSFLRFLRNSDARVADGNGCMMFVLLQFDGDFPALTVIFHGV